MRNRPRIPSNAKRMASQSQWTSLMRSPSPPWAPGGWWWQFLPHSIIPMVCDESDKPKLPMFRVIIYETKPISRTVLAPPQLPAAMRTSRHPVPQRMFLLNRGCADSFPVRRYEMLPAMSSHLPPGGINQPDQHDHDENAAEHAQAIGIYEAEPADGHGFVRRLGRRWLQRQHQLNDQHW